MEDVQQVHKLADKDTLDLIKAITCRVCAKFSIDRSEWDDINNSVILHMLKSNYIPRFDQAKGKFHIFLYGLIRNCVSKWSKKSRRGSHIFVSFDETFSDDSGGKSSKMDYIRDPSIFINELQLSDDVIFLMEELNRSFDFHSYVVYHDGKIVRSCVYNKGDTIILGEGEILFKRSVAVIFWLLYLGYQQSQITDILQVSRPWISKKTALIRESDAFKRWATALRKDGITSRPII